MKLTDYITRHLVDYGVKHVFMITGGGAMHLNDSFGYEPRLKCIFNHHEQACAMAAEGYARVTGKVGVVNVTTGPGGINALNGVFGAWTDSIPMLVISGQVKRETLLATYNIKGLRQLGDQEADIISMVKSITKYSVLVTEPQSIGYHLSKALYLATHGRPGPCWLDIPIDVQASIIDQTQIIPYDSLDDEPKYPIKQLPEICSDILHRLQIAERPVIMVGKGVRLAGALDIFNKVIQKLQIPVVTAWTAIDSLASDHPLYCGLPGDLGGRAGNFTVQNSDLLLIIGSRLCLRQISYNWKSFARCAYKIQVDADLAELNKPTVKPDLPIYCDAKLFLEEMNRQIDAMTIWSSRHDNWLTWCRQRLVRYPATRADQCIVKNGLINPYHFIDRLFFLLEADDVIVCGNGAANVITFQAAIIKAGQRVFCNTGNASMGYDLPAAIGAAIAHHGKRIICIAGDGSIQLNIQELQTVVHNVLPIKIFVLNNGGYLSMRTTQEKFFGRYIGESPQSGVSFPDIVGLAQAYGLQSMRIEGEGFETIMKNALNLSGPVLCEIMLDSLQPFEPKLSSEQLPDGRMVSKPLEDMYPFLSREEFESNMIIPPWEPEK